MRNDQTTAEAPIGEEAENKIDDPHQREPDASVFHTEGEEVLDPKDLLYRNPTKEDIEETLWCGPNSTCVAAAPQKIVAEELVGSDEPAFLFSQLTKEKTQKKKKHPKRSAVRARKQDQRGRKGPPR